MTIQGKTHTQRVSVEKQLRHFQSHISDLQKLGLVGADLNDMSLLDQLHNSAPEWPDGRHQFRVIQIRKGYGTEGVRTTFEAHLWLMARVFGGLFYRSPADSKQLVHARCQDEHLPVVRWVCIDLNTHRERKSILDTRSAVSLSDELLACAWQFPEHFKQIDYDQIPGYCAAGYEYDCFGDRSWMRTPIVRRRMRDGAINVNQTALVHNDTLGAEYAVPTRLSVHSL